jgi:hypothetical protein
MLLKGWDLGHLWRFSATTLEPKLVQVPCGISVVGIPSNDGITGEEFATVKLAMTEWWCCGCNCVLCEF